MPLTEIVPGTDLALNRLQEILGKTKDPALQDLEHSLDTLSANIEKSREETLYLVRNARSAEQISETRIPWNRNRRELEDLNDALQSHVQSLIEQEHQVREIQERWSLGYKPVEGVAFPQGLLERVQRVQESVSRADEAIRASLEFLVKLQVRISKSHGAVDEVSQQMGAAEERLHENVFVFDSPPLWSALRGKFVRLSKGAGPHHNDSGSVERREFPFLIPQQSARVSCSSAGSVRRLFPPAQGHG
jgi:hypothetical protein